MTTDTEAWVADDNPSCGKVATLKPASRRTD
jgi:hypothetical protein